ncbi:MAG: response regulator [Tannerella sp.]|nr:response regulator [Tannerella sp.]
MKNRIVLLFFINWVVLAGATAESDLFSSRYKVSYITMDNGLSNNFVEDIYKDRQGFLWIATSGGGLSRYDGYDFLNFNTNTAPVKVRSNFVLTLCEDAFNRLWVVSDGGIDVIDMNTLKIAEIQEIESIQSQQAVNVFNDSKGNIWVYCGDSLHKICFDGQGKVIRKYSLFHKLGSIKAIAMQDIDNDGDIWVSLNNRICKIITTDAGELKISEISSTLEFESDILITSLLPKEHELWIGSDRGLIRFDRTNEKLKIYTHQINSPASLSHDFVTDLAVNDSKKLIISTLSGVNFYNPISDDFECIRHSDNALRGSFLNSDFVNCLLADGEKIWIGTETGGINRMSLKSLSVENFEHDREDAGSLSANPVNAIYEDSDGVLWIGTVEGGLNRKVPGSAVFKHFTEESSSRLSHNSVSAITADNQERLWVGTWGNGITLLDVKHPEKQALSYISNPSYRGSLFIGALIFDATNNGMWIGCNPGLFFYHLDTRQFEIPFEGAQHIPGIIGAVIDRDNYLWVGSLDGVYQINLKKSDNKQFGYQNFRYKLDDPASEIIEKISAFCLTSDGELWIGSNGNGIYKLTDSLHFMSVSTQNGLISNNVRGILEDREGKLWISADKGLSVLDRRSEKITNYSKEDGLPGNQFYWNAYCASKSGDLYFGNLLGLVKINPVNRILPTADTKVTLTKLYIGGKEIIAGNKYSENDVSRATVLRLHERDKSFSLEFSALNYESRYNAVYRYLLEGFDKQWITTPATRRFANYTNLPAGKYTFKIKYIPEGTAENDAPATELTVIVKPYFYKTFRFVSVVFIFLIIGILRFYKRKQAVQRRKLKEMEQKVQEMTVDKLSFFTNITHEFRTPITLITGPIERALKLSTNPQVVEQLNFVQRNSKYLLSLVNQLMDFRKVESGKLEIVKTENHFVEFLDSVLLPFEAFANERHIEIRKFYRLGNPVVSIDRSAMQKVINNLTSNAIKFTPNGGKVSVYAALCHHSSLLYVGIKDTGTGLSDEDLERVFERFYQSKNNTQYPIYGQSGTGIGLYLSKSLVEMHGGRIQAKNNRRKGCTFHFTIPVENPEQTKSADVSEQVTDISANTLIKNTFDQKITVLVIEDNPDMRDYIKSILVPQYHVVLAGNGLEGLAQLSHFQIDFIVCDMMMPVMDGLEFSRKVKENFSTSHIPILILTAKTTNEARIASYKVGVEEYLMKPFDDEVLTARIANILENRKRHHGQFAVTMKIDDLKIDGESSDMKFLNRAIETVKSNHKNSEFDVSEFSEEMGVSKSLLNTKLQSLTGQPTGQFIRNYRLNVAHELILHNRTTKNMNISDIAYEVGFNDPKYFTRCFTKLFGVAPRDCVK